MKYILPIILLIQTVYAAGILKPEDEDRARIITGNIALGNFGDIREDLVFYWKKVKNIMILEW